MKKMYSEPQTKEFLLEAESAILAGSVVGEEEGFTPPAMPNPGLHPAPARNSAAPKIRYF